MEAVSSSIIETNNWLSASLPLAMFVLAAAPAVMLLRGNRVVVACALVLLAGAVLLILQGLTGLQFAFAVAAINLLLVSVSLSHTRKLVIEMKSGFEALEAAIRNLETSEERRKVFIAREPLEAANSTNESKESKDATDDSRPVAGKLRYF